MNAVYVLLWLFCITAFLVLLLEWIRVERQARQRARVLEIHARKLRSREVF